MNPEPGSVMPEDQQGEELERAPFHAPYKSRASGTFPVMEIFGPTIQGEGIMIGEKTHFIRMGGCDYRCKMCDSMHAVDPEAVKAHAKWMTVRDLVESTCKLDTCIGNKTPWVTLSGGNPAMWDLSDLVIGLHAAGYKVAVETQGSIWRPWLADVDCLTISPKSPGMGERFDQEAFSKFCAMVEDSYTRMIGALSVCIKIPVFNCVDLEFAAGVSQILDDRNKTEEAIFWPPSDRYLSVGNSYPPILDPTTKTQKLDPRIEDSLVSTLLRDYNVLLEDYLTDSRLQHWKFLPQLHVLVYGNRAGV